MKLRLKKKPEVPAKKPTVLKGSEREQAFLTKVITTGDVSKALKEKATAELLIDVDNREVWVWLLSKYKRHGQCPSLAMTRAEFPDFQPIEVRDNIPLLLEELRTKKLYNDVQNSLSEVNKAARQDPRYALKLLKEASLELAKEHSNGQYLDLTKSADLTRKEYKQNQKSKGMLGVPYLWPKVNKSTRGKRKGQLIGYYGRTGAKKTFLMLADAEYSNTVHHQVVLFITREMLVEEIQERWICLRAKLDYEKYQDGALDKKQKAQLDKTLEEIGREDAVPFHVTTVTGYGDEAIAEIVSLIREHEATLVYVDGAYFYSEDGDYKSFMKISNGLKEIALKEKVAVIASTQANTVKQKHGVGETDDVGSGQSFAQACDVLIRVTIEKQNEEQDEAVLTGKKVRKGKRFDTTINAIPCTDFSQKYQEEDEEALRDGLDDQSDGMLQ